MTGFIRSQFVHVGATATAAIVALGLVTVPPARYDSAITRSELEIAQLQVVLATQVSALANSAPQPVVASKTSSAAAAATTDESLSSFLASPLGTVLGLAYVAVILPIWFLFTPITLPLSMFAGAFAGAALPDTDSSSDTLNAFVFLTVTALTFLTGPVGLLSVFAAPNSSPAAAVSNRSAAATQQVEARAAIIADVAAAVDELAPGATRHSIGSPGRQRGSARSGRSVMQLAATVANPAEAQLATSTADRSDITPNATDIPTASELATDATSIRAADTVADAPSAETIAPSTATKKTDRAPSRQRRAINPRPQPVASPHSSTADAT